MFFSLPHFPSNPNCLLLTPPNENQFHQHIFPQQKTRRRPLKSIKASRETSIPARDRVIEFGKYKGKMLGTLPSTYLQWVSNNLRARDFEEWAKLADQVLQDPVYKDRLEWESAERVLNGDVLRSGGSSNRGGSKQQQQSPVSDLLEISEGFGWDNEDKVGWSKVDFELLGTSKGGRIPRIGAEQKRERESRRVKGFDEGNNLTMDRRRGGEIGGVRERVDTDDSVRGRRRERLRTKRSGSGRTSKFSMNRLGGRESEGSEDDGGDDGDQRGELKNPFPGREALLRKVLRRSRGPL